MMAVSFIGGGNQSAWRKSLYVCKYVYQYSCICVFHDIVLKEYKFKLKTILDCKIRGTFVLECRID
jgi:hypothetical protein